MSSRNISRGPGGASHFGANRVLLVALTLWALAMIVPAFHRVFDTLGSFGLSVDNDGIVTDVLTPFRSAADSPAAVAGIVPGDRVDLKAMRCIPVRTPQCASLVALLAGLGGLHAVLPHRQIVLTIKSSSGPSKTVRLQSLPAPLNPIERVVLFADTLVGVAVIMIAFWLVWTRRSWMTWGLFLYVIWINPGQSYSYYALLQRWPIAVPAQEVAEALACGLAFAGLIIFALRFPNDRTEPRWQKVQSAVPLLAAIMSILTLLSFCNLFGFQTERYAQFSFLAGFVVDVAVLLILLERRRTLPPQDEQRMLWVIWGCAIGLPTFIFAELCQSSDLILHLWGSSPSQALIGLLYLPNGVLAYLASQAVWQRRVVSVMIPLRHGTILAALGLAMGVPVVLLDQKLTLFEQGLPLPSWIWLLAVAPVLLLLLNRLQEFAVDLVDHFVNRKFHSARKQLESASEAIARAKTLIEVDRLLVEVPVCALCLSSGAIFRCDGSVFRRTKDTKGWDGSMKKELQPETDAIILRSITVGTPVRIDPDGCDLPDMPTGLEAPCLSVPVPSAIPEASAVLLFGPHETGNDIHPDEREMLDQLAARAATAYERVFTNLLRQEIAQMKADLIAFQRDSRMERGNP